MKIDTLKIKILLSHKMKSITDLADAIGMQPNNLSCILRRGTCSLKTAGRIAHGLDVGIEEIWIRT